MLGKAINRWLMNLLYIYIYITIVLNNNLRNLWIEIRVDVDRKE